MSRRIVPGSHGAKNGAPPIMASMPSSSIGTATTMVRFLKDQWTRDLFDVPYFRMLTWDGMSRRGLPGLSMPNAISGDTSERFDASIGECATAMSAAQSYARDTFHRPRCSSSAFQSPSPTTVAMAGPICGSIPNTPLDIAKLAKSLAKKGMSWSSATSGLLRLWNPSAAQRARPQMSVIAPSRFTQAG